MSEQYWLTIVINVGITGVIGFFLRHHFIETKEAIKLVYNLITHIKVQEIEHKNLTLEIGRIDIDVKKIDNKLDKVIEEHNGTKTTLSNLVQFHNYQHQENKVDGH